MRTSKIMEGFAGIILDDNTIENLFPEVKETKLDKVYWQSWNI
jgi:hypothetical protein